VAWFVKCYRRLLGFLWVESGVTTGGDEGSGAARLVRRWLIGCLAWQPGGPGFPVASRPGAQGRLRPEHRKRRGSLLEGERRRSRLLVKPWAGVDAASCPVLLAGSQAAVEQGTSAAP
jgi:hypothetical protein